MFVDIYRPGPPPEENEAETKVTKTQILAALAVSMGSMIVGMKLCGLDQCGFAIVRFIF